MQKEQKDLKYWSAFNEISFMGPRRFKKIYSYFSSMEQAWSAGKSEFIKSGLDSQVSEQIIEKRTKIDPELVWQKIEQEKVKVITIRDSSYPKLLKEIYDAPAVILCKGSFEKSDDFALGIVGTRRPSAYGKRVARDMSYDLAKAGLVIVSGLAFGIDTIAHKAALEAGGRTIAVLGSGLSEQSIYPQDNKELAKEIAKAGAVISDFPLNMPSLPQHFPYRNRIISGLCRGVLIIEAAEKSGALITANSALDQNREVFAVPGSIFSETSKGTNYLIKSGAKLVDCAQDILEELNLESVKSYVETREILPDSKEEARILENLSQEPLHVNALIKKTGFPVSQVNALLSVMEIKGMVRNLGSGMYVRGK